MKKLMVVMVLGLVLLGGCKKATTDNAPAGGEKEPAAVDKAPVEAKPAAAIKLTYANFPPAATFPCVQMERWKDEVQKRSNGKVEVQTFPGGTLLEAKDIMDGVIQGQADIGCLCMAYQPGRFVVTNATSLPLNIASAKVGSQVLWALYKKYQPEEFAQVKVLTMFATAPSNIMSLTPVRTLEDIKGMPLRASGSASMILKAWGANDVGMPMSETPEALQKGVVKGLFTSLEVMKDFKYAELCKSITMTQTNIYPFAVVMNKQKWEALPEDIKQLFDGMSEEQCLWTGEYMDNHVKEAVEWSKTEQKVEVVEIAADQLVQWNKLLEPMTVDWIKSAKEKNLPAEEIMSDIKGWIELFSFDPKP